MSILKEYDDSYRLEGNNLIAGFDEAGRGPLCGPVVVAGVILPANFDNSLINDSKQLTDKKRRILFDEIISKAIYYHISIISPQTIDEINILEASRLGMQEALESMIKDGLTPDVVITDYMKLKTDSKLVAIKKGDATSLSVAAASILAKVTRDDILLKYDEKYPQYGFAKHKGYPTKAHMMAIEEYGLIDGIYRLSYKPVQLILNKVKQ